MTDERWMIQQSDGDRAVWWDSYGRCWGLPFRGALYLTYREAVTAMAAIDDGTTLGDDVRIVSQRQVLESRGLHGSATSERMMQREDYARQKALHAAGEDPWLYPKAEPHHCLSCNAPCRLCGGVGHCRVTHKDGTSEHVWCWWCVTPSYALRRPYDGPADETPVEMTNG